MPEANELRIVARFRNAVVHSYVGGELFFSRGNSVYAIADLDDPRPREVARIPWSVADRLCGWRLVDRVLKKSILQVHRSPRGEYLVSSARSWWRASGTDDARELKPFADTRPMNRGICESTRGTVYVAEYRSNPERQPIHIYRSRNLLDFEVAWTFPRKEIRHVHALIPDPRRKTRIWVLTGDTDRECGILYTDDEFETLHPWFHGTQQARATDLVFRDGYLYWGMDSPDETSFVLRRARDSDDVPERLCELPGPAYYMTQNEAGGVYVGTTVERGEGVRDRFGHLVRLSGRGRWEELLKRKKDFAPQFGIFSFPRGQLPENFVVYAQRALKPHEGCLTIGRDLSWDI